MRPATWSRSSSAASLHAENDSYIPADQPGQLFEAAGEPKEMWMAPGSDHAVARLDHPQEYRRRILEFFDRSLRGTKSLRRGANTV